MGNICEMLGASFFLVLSMMSILWIIYFFKRNAGIVDIGWSLAFMLAMAAYLLIGEAALSKKILLTAMVWCWSARLGWHLFQRYLTTEEDFRYREIREQWGEENSNFKMFIMFIFQGVLAVFLSLPFLIVAHTAEAAWHGIEVLGCLVWLVGITGEALADRDLEKFKQNPENKHKVCNAGLWRYSRHPNYFFEFVVWVGFFLFALGSPVGWLAIVSPVLILVLLTQVSGIPMVEAQALKSKGSEYRSYQETTSMFIPWFPKAPKNEQAVKK